MQIKCLVSRPLARLISTIQLNDIIIINIIKPFGCGHEICLSWCLQRLLTSRACARYCYETEGSFLSGEWRHQFHRTFQGDLGVSV